MTINKISSPTAFVALVFFFVLAFCIASPTVTSAQAYDYGCCDYSFDWGGSDSSYSWGDDRYYDWGGDYSYSWGDDYSYSFGQGTWIDDIAGNWYDDVPGMWYDDVPGVWYDEPLYASTPSCYSCGGYGYGGSYGYGGGFVSSYFPLSFSTPITPITIAPPIRPTTPIFGGGSSVVNNNTNINNSINGSFNNYNSGNTTIATVYPATPQIPVVYQAPSCTINHALAGGYGSSNMAYLSWTSTNATTAYLTNIGSVAVSGNQTVYPTVTTTYTLTVYNAQGQSANCSTTVAISYVPPVQNMYCSIYANPTTIQNGNSTTLSWNSTGATSAWLSDGIGSVAVNGSVAVRPESSRTYTLTVYGTQGTRTCSTTVNVQGAYVSLTQIPYTGFDLGPIGNAAYWLGLVSFAIAGAYLALYYVPRTVAGNFRFALAPKTAFKPVVFEEEVSEEVVAPNVQPIVHSILRTNTVDSMAIVQSKDGSMPKIVITRN